MARKMSKKSATAAMERRHAGSCESGETAQGGRHAIRPYECIRAYRQENRGLGRLAAARAGPSRRLRSGVSLVVVDRRAQIIAAVAPSTA